MKNKQHPKYLGKSYLMKICLAGPLFAEAEQNWLRKTKQQIESFAKSRDKDIEVVWPYELIDRDEVQSLGNKAKYRSIPRL